VTLKIAQKGPYRVKLEKDQVYAWCTCGLSATQPFCDGSHKGSGMKSFKFTTQDTGMANLCGCKHTKTPPYCDGSHCALEDI